MGNIIEALSWIMATEICRRDPRINIFETHPGGGLYDCLSLHHADLGHLADLNRAGSIHVFKRLDGMRSPRPWNAWKVSLSVNTRSLVDMFSEKLGQTVPTRLAPSTSRNLIYRTASMALSIGAFKPEQWECRSGYADAYGSRVASHFDCFPAASGRLACGSEPEVYASAIQFWFLLMNAEPVACLHESGTGWNRAGEEISITSTYAERQRLWPAVERLLADAIG